MHAIGAERMVEAAVLPYEPDRREVRIAVGAMRRHAGHDPAVEVLVDLRLGECVFRRRRGLVAHRASARVPGDTSARAGYAQPERPTYTWSTIDGTAVRHLPVGAAPARDGREPDRARLLRAGAAGARARVRRRFRRAALPHPAVPDAAARAPARAHRRRGGGDARVLGHPPADAAQSGRGRRERRHARRHHATDASCSAWGSATARRRTTRSACPRSGCASSSRSSTSCDALLEGEAVTAEGHGFRLARSAARTAADAAPRPAHLARREQRQGRAAGRAARPTPGC